ncbi:DUF3185 domain-containing protein [Fundidesulfovibrio soli]|uniref:DUF3185 domain-containing protein n=1 Tax=Fundidesulfovibrio soli TaxID=2922716 RepID=UPI001FAFF1A0|nr:DUF3185 domain-containing protein [Fundidesulfovibrio soli]
MRTITIVAVLLMLAGGAVLGYQGITYTTKENVIDLGPLKVTTETTRTVPMPLIAGGLALVGGVALLLLARKK